MAINVEQDEVLWDATFNPKVKTYWLLSGAFILLATLFGIVLIPFWFLLGGFFTQRYLDRMKCTLTTRSLHVSKGLFIRVEKTVPLDKITDIGLVTGPIMRSMGLHALSVETAGQSAAGALIRMVGIESTEEFRQKILDQRDAVALAKSERGSTTPPLPGGVSDPVLLEIRDTLGRIEEHLRAQST